MVTLTWRFRVHMSGAPARVRPSITVGPHFVPAGGAGWRMVADTFTSKSLKRHGVWAGVGAGGAAEPDPAPDPAPAPEPRSACSGVGPFSGAGGAFTGAGGAFTGAGGAFTGAGGAFTGAGGGATTGSTSRGVKAVLSVPTAPSKSDRRVPLIVGVVNASAPRRLARTRGIGSSGVIAAAGYVTARRTTGEPAPCCT